MLKFCTLIFFAATLIMISCKKGEQVEEFYFASFKAELLQLPGTPTMDVYVNNSLVDTLAPGKVIGLSSPLMLAANKKSELVFKTKSTNTVLLDTVVNAAAGAQLSFKLAASDVLGILSFLKDEGSSIALDSAALFIFNQLPEQVQSNDVSVDAYLFKVEGVDFVETGISWNNFERNKLHPNLVVLPLNDESEMPITYVLKFKNRATGEFLMDQFNADYTPSLILTPGKTNIVTATAAQNRGRWKFNLQSSEL